MATKATITQTEKAHVKRAPAARATTRIDGTDSMPRDGFGRWRHFGRFVGISREKWRQLVLEGKAPRPMYMGARCALYKFSEIHQWLADPLNYRAPAVPAAAVTNTESHAGASPQSKRRRGRAMVSSAETGVGAEG